jgi:hypothetical protein
VKRWFALAILGCVSLAAQTVHFTLISSLEAPHDLVKLHGTRAYLAGGKVLTLFDLSSPASPRREGQFEFADRIWGFNVVGSLVYVADDLAGLAILDVSDPAKPRLRGTLKTHGQAKAVVISGTKALLVDHMDGLALVDVSDVAKPTPAGSLFLDGYARDVALSGSLAYAVDSPNGFYAVDLSKPGPLDFAGSIQSANGQTVAVSGSIACVPGRGGLQVFDVSNPSAPVLAATLKTPGAPQRVTIRGKRAYLADGREGLQVVDLSDPSKPAIIGMYKTASPARDVAVGEGLVLVATVNEGTVVLREMP